MLDGPILAELQAAYEADGLKLFGYADSGFRVMTSSKAVRQMSDFSGIKIRTMENPNHIAYWQALGANPTPADFSELYMSLEQGTLDAQENPYDLIVANKLYEPQAYVIETNHLLHTLNMVAARPPMTPCPLISSSWSVSALLRPISMPVKWPTSASKDRSPPFRMPAWRSSLWSPP